MTTDREAILIPLSKSEVSSVFIRSKSDHTCISLLQDTDCIYIEKGNVEKFIEILKTIQNENLPAV